MGAADARKSQTVGLRERFDGAVAAACVIVTAAVYLVHVLESDVLMTAEQASDLLAGMEMLRQKAVFLRDWRYAEEAFTLRSPLAAALAGILAGGSAIQAHRLSVILELAAEILALAYMLRRLGLRGRAGVLAAALFFGARSYPSGLLCGMGFAGDASFHAALFLTLGYLAAARTGTRGLPERILKFALPAAAFLFGLSSIVLFALLYFPLLAHRLWRALSAERGFRPQQGDLLGEVAAWNALFALGYLILCLAVATPERGPVLLTSGESAGLYYAVTINIPLLLGQLADASPLRHVQGAAAFASLGWYAGMAFFALALYALFSAPGAVSGDGGPAGDALRALAVCLGSALAFATVHLFSPQSSARYLAFLYPFGAVLLSSRWLRLSESSPGRARLVYLSLSAAVLLIGANNIAALPRQVADGRSRPAARHADDIAGFLAANGVSRAYALYWDSYNLEVLTSGAVRVGAVDGLLRPFLKNVSLAKYRPGPPGERTAFVRSRNPRPWSDPSMELQDPSLLEPALGYAEFDDPSNPVRVYVFEGNPFTFEAADARAAAARRPVGGPAPGEDALDGGPAPGEGAPGGGAATGEGVPAAGAAPGEGAPGADAGPGTDGPVGGLPGAEPGGGDLAGDGAVSQSGGSSGELPGSGGSGVLPGGGVPPPGPARERQ
jgi:hypothetical protein